METVQHIHNYGPHRCKRGHSFRVHFDINKEGLTSGYLKVCRRCGHDEQRELTRSGNKVVRIERVIVGNESGGVFPQGESDASNFP